MKIKFGKLSPRSFAWDWRPDQRILLVGLWFFVMGVDFGLEKSGWFRHFHSKCQLPSCSEPLHPHSRTQIVRFHGNCRTEGRAHLRAVEKQKRYAHA